MMAAQVEIIGDEPRGVAVEGAGVGCGERRLRLDAAMAGRTLVIRATDAMNNVGSGEVVLK